MITGKCPYHAPPTRSGSPRDQTGTREPARGGRRKLMPPNLYPPTLGIPPRPLPSPLFPKSTFLQRKSGPSSVCDLFLHAAPGFSDESMFTCTPFRLPSSLALFQLAREDCFRRAGMYAWSVFVHVFFCAGTDGRRDLNATPSRKGCGEDRVQQRQLQSRGAQGRGGDLCACRRGDWGVPGTSPP